MSFWSFGAVGSIVRGVFRQPDAMKPDPNDRWKIRRTLTIGATVFGALMIITGAIGMFSSLYTDALVFGGVTIVSAVLAAYQTMATYDDKWHGNGDHPDG